MVSDTSTAAARQQSRLPLGLSSYQWAVLFAAWLGWGFDVFDGLLFNFVAPNAVPTLLHLTIGSKEAQAATPYWTGIATAILLLGWAAGGVIFGYVADRIGRTKTLLLTMLMYALGTTCCAFAPNVTMLLLFRVVAGLGIGGEWAAGASLVAEVVPENRRVEAGALLYTSAPMGLFLATFANKMIAGVFFKGVPEVSWRYVLLCGLIPAAFAVFVRFFVHEPERWKTARAQAAPRLRELFTRENRALTISGLIPAVTILIAWWSCNAFISVLAAALARQTGGRLHLDKPQTLALIAQYQLIANNCFNIGGLIGTLLTIPAAHKLGRRKMYFFYLLLSSAAFFAVFGLDLPPVMRLYGYFLVGLTIFGVFGSFTYYLPELFPTRLRATGSGFCYNIGRVVASVGAFSIGKIAAGGVPAMLHALFAIGFVPLIGILLLPWVIETRGKALSD